MEEPLRFSAQKPSSRLEEILSTSDRVEELSDSENEYEDMGTATQEEQTNIAYLESVRTPIKDSLVTESSEIQDEVLQIVLPYLEGNPNDFPLSMFGLPRLQRKKHMAFLMQALGDLPSQLTVLDASRPWLIYWSLQGLSALGNDVTEFRERVIHTCSLAQHPSGGHGGGLGQLAHLAPTYAAVLSLAMVGGSDAYNSIDRKGMWHYIGRMKQADGGFTLAENGEEDIRGAYCALVVMSILDIPLDLPPDAPARQHGMTSFLDKLGGWVSACQTYEGGISASPGNEAHGAYAFCGLACLSIVGPPTETLHKYLDVPLLIHWLSSRQCSPEGGYNGRTNKLVDGCYSHWVGGCWPLVESATEQGISNRNALGRYILSATQFKKGGLIDKPGKRPDAYHTCYNLAGLSRVQHDYVFDKKHQVDLGNGTLGAPYHWKCEGLNETDQLWDQTDILKEVHPVFVIPFKAAEDSRRYFEQKEGF